MGAYSGRQDSSQPSSEIFTNKGIGTAILREDGENIMMSMHEQMEQAEKVFSYSITDFRLCLTTGKAAGFMIQTEKYLDFAAGIAVNALGDIIIPAMMRR